eukprot:COSAG01_NODE_889_length_12914_cov_3.351775_1_plen_4223_part_10
MYYAVRTSTALYATVCTSSYEYSCTALWLYTLYWYNIHCHQKILCSGAIVRHPRNPQLAAETHGADAPSHASTTRNHPSQRKLQATGSTALRFSDGQLLLDVPSDTCSSFVRPTRKTVKVSSTSRDGGLAKECRGIGQLYSNDSWTAATTNAGEKRCWHCVSIRFRACFSAALLTGCHFMLGEWWQADVGVVTSIVAVHTQGGQSTCNGARVTSFTVQSSIDGKLWNRVDKGKVFSGNIGTSSPIVNNTFSLPVVARFVRVTPVSWHSRITMRVALSVGAECKACPAGRYGFGEISRVDSSGCIDCPKGTAGAANLRSVDQCTPCARDTYANRTGVPLHCQSCPAGKSTALTLKFSRQHTVDFESGWESWQNSGRNRWVRGTRTPSSSTGATKAATGKYFAFLETSAPSNTGWTSYLTSPKFQGLVSIHFKYHMHGYTMGTLSVEALTTSTTIPGQTAWQLLWKRVGQQQSRMQDAWLSSGTVRLATGTTSVRLKGYAGSSWTGDMSVDDIRLSRTWYSYNIDGDLTRHDAPEDCVRACPAGQYAKNIHSDTCVRCPVGTYSNTPNITDVEQCVNCPIGSYNSKTGQLAAANCIMCPVGKTTVVSGPTGQSKSSDCVISGPCSFDVDTCHWKTCPGDCKLGVVPASGTWQRVKFKSSVSTSWDNCSALSKTGFLALKPNAPAQTKGEGRSGTCVFPFIYNGATYLSCADSQLHLGTGWCAFDSVYKSGQWGYCAPSCPQLAPAILNVPYSGHKYSTVWAGNAVGYSHGTGRLGSNQAWSAGVNQAGQWMQMDTRRILAVAGVQTQGRASGCCADQRVVSYRVSTSSDGSTWSYAMPVIPGAGTTWTKCANENQKCGCVGDVRYGTATHMWTTPKPSLGEIMCSNAVFGDPVYGVAKSCECKWSPKTDVFPGNMQNGGPTVTIKFAQPVMARFVRLVVVGWNGHISMRAALFHIAMTPPALGGRSTAFLQLDTRQVPSNIYLTSANIIGGMRSMVLSYLLYGLPSKTASMSVQTTNDTKTWLTPWTLLPKAHKGRTFTWLNATIQIRNGTTNARIVAKGMAVAVDNIEFLSRTACSQGQYGGGRLGPCTGCPVGTEQLESAITIAASACFPCQPGLHDHDRNPATTCQRCPAGRYLNSTSAVVCKICPPGTEQLGDGATQCYACKIGQADSDSDPATACQRCQSGRIATVPRATSCTRCSSGTFTTENAIASKCVQCPPGQMDADGDPATKCLLCDSGRYENRSGQYAAGVSSNSYTYLRLSSASNVGSRSGSWDLYQFECFDANKKKVALTVTAASHGLSKTISVINGDLSTYWAGSASLCGGYLLFHGCQWITFKFPRPMSNVQCSVRNHASDIRWAITQVTTEVSTDNVAWSLPRPDKISIKGQTTFAITPKEDNDIFSTVLKCGAPACEYQYTGIGGSRVYHLGNNAKFPDSPTKVLALTTGSLQMTQKGDNIGAMLEGFVLAPRTGLYSFSTWTDDSSELWAANRPNTKYRLQKMVELIGCCRKVNGVRRVVWTQGKAYYIRAYVKEGGGGEYGRWGMTVAGKEYHPIPIQMFASPKASCPGTCSNGTYLGSTTGPCEACIAGLADHDMSPTTPCTPCRPGRFSTERGYAVPKGLHYIHEFKGTEVVSNVAYDLTKVKLGPTDFTTSPGAVWSKGFVRIKQGNHFIDTKAIHARPVDVSVTMRQVSGNQDCGVIAVFPTSNSRHSGYNLGLGWWGNGFGTGKGSALQRSATIIHGSHWQNLRVNVRADGVVRFYLNGALKRTIIDNTLTKGVLRLGNNCRDFEYKDIVVSHSASSVSAGSVYTTQKCQDDEVKMQCPDGSTINVISASFGRFGAGMCPKDFPFAFRPANNFDQCCASADDCNGKVGINSGHRMSRAQCCKANKIKACISSPCQDFSTSWGSCSALSKTGFLALKPNAPAQTKGEGRSGTCVFPFIYNGVTYTSCADSHLYLGTGWCAFDSVYKSGQWGYCAPSCPFRHLGNRTNTKCGHASANSTCHAANSLAVVKTACHHKQQCSVKASTSIFGDPCSGTYKYLEVKYDCLKSCDSVKLLCGDLACEHVWTGISGSRVADLTKNSKFPNSPDKVLKVKTSFQTSHHGDNYGAMLEGFIKAPITGDYTFSVDSDDASVVHAAVDVKTKVGLVKVVELTSCCRKVMGSTRVKWSAGQVYYVEAFVKEGGGGDHLKVGISFGGKEYHPIPISMFAAPVESWCRNFYKPKLQCEKPVCAHEWTGIGGKEVQDLVSHHTFPDDPTRVNENKNGNFQISHAVTASGTMLEGFVLAPKTGRYVFMLHADDASEVWTTSESNSKDDLTKVAELPHAIIAQGMCSVAFPHAYGTLRSRCCTSAHDAYNNTDANSGALHARSTTCGGKSQRCANPPCDDYSSQGMRTACGTPKSRHWCNNNHKADIKLGVAASAAECGRMCSAVDITGTNFPYGCCQWKGGSSWPAADRNQCYLMPSGKDTTWADATKYHSSPCSRKSTEPCVCRGLSQAAAPGFSPGCCRTTSSTDLVPVLPAIRIPIVSCAASTMFSTSQSCQKAFDGMITTDWVTKGQGVGAWIRFDLQGANQTVNLLKIRQRDGSEKNQDCLVSFSDGTSVTITLANDNSVQSVALPTVTTTYVKLEIKSVYHTINNGFKEVEIWGGGNRKGSAISTISLAKVSSVMNWIAGQTYYVRAFIKSDGGGDYMSVGMRVLGGVIYDPIPTSMFVGAFAHCPKVCPAGTIESNGQCKQCAAGLYDHDMDAGTPCERCTAGLYSSSIGQTSCVRCPAGSVSTRDYVRADLKQYERHTCKTVRTANRAGFYTVLSKPLGISKSLYFTVKAANDAHIGFFSDKQSKSEVYEVVLSGWGNTQSAIRKKSQGSNKVVAATRGMLNSGEARQFWVDVTNGHVRVGKGHSLGANKIMEWQDPFPHIVVSVGVMTGWGSTGAWSICHDGWLPWYWAGTPAAPLTFMFSTGCSNCSSGHYDHDSDAATACVACPRGFFSTKDSIACKNCGAGRYSVAGSNSSASCVACSVGKYDIDKDARTPCVYCPSGRYSFQPGSTSCKAFCPNGTFASDESSFMFLETSAPSVKGDTSYLVSPPQAHNCSTVTFMYHMHGATMGTLSLNALSGGNWSSVWNKTGQQQTQQADPWRSSGTIRLPAGTLRVRFAGVRGSGWTGAMGVDNVMLSMAGGAKQSLLSSFESSTEGWINSGKRKWVRGARTPSISTGATVGSLVPSSQSAISVICTKCRPGTIDSDLDAETPCVPCMEGKFSGQAGGTKCAVCPSTSTGTSSALPFRRGYVSSRECNQCSGARQCKQNRGLYCSPSNRYGATGTCQKCTGSDCGCTDRLAINYKPGALRDDSSCTYQTRCDSNVSSGWSCYPTIKTMLQSISAWKGSPFLYRLNKVPNKVCSDGRHHASQCDTSCCARACSALGTCSHFTSIDGNCRLSHSGCKWTGGLLNYGGTGCTAAKKCTMCEGDCDSDNDCQSGMYCFQRNAKERVPGCTPGGPGDVNIYDYCVPRTARLTTYPVNVFAKVQDTQRLELAQWCQSQVFVVSCNASSTYSANHNCQKASDGSWGTDWATQGQGAGSWIELNLLRKSLPLVSYGGTGCTSAKKCTKCKGDCDSDNDCQPGTYCFQRTGMSQVPGCTKGGVGDVHDYDYCVPRYYTHAAAYTREPQNYTLNLMKITQRAGNEKSRDILMSFSDGTSFNITLADHNGVQFVALPTVTTTYVKLQIKTAYNAINNGFKEIELFGPMHGLGVTPTECNRVTPKECLDNLDQSKDTDVSLGPGVRSNGSPNLFIDMDISPGTYTACPTGSAPLCSKPLYVTVDLGSIQIVEYATVWNYYADKRRYCGQKLALSLTGAFTGEELVVMDDKGAYGPVETAAGRTTAFRPIRTRYARYWCARNTKNTGVHFIEMDLYGQRLGAQPVIGRVCEDGGLPAECMHRSNIGSLVASSPVACVSSSGDCIKAIDSSKATYSRISAQSSCGMQKMKFVIDQAGPIAGFTVRTDHSHAAPALNAGKNRYKTNPAISLRIRVDGVRVPQVCATLASGIVIDVPRRSHNITADTWSISGWEPRGTLATFSWPPIVGSSIVVEFEEAQGESGRSSIDCAIDGYTHWHIADLQVLAPKHGLVLLEQIADKSRQVPCEPLQLPEPNIFMFLETSAPSVKGDTSYLVSPPQAHNYSTVTFMYHMHGATMGTLSLNELSGGNWSSVWNKTGQQQTQQADPWRSSGTIRL